jgi:hypothetical protein
MRSNKVETPEFPEHTTERFRESTYATRTESFLALIVESGATRGCVARYAKESTMTIKTVTKSTGGLT